MGVYIPGMEMPKSCRECRFDRGGWCYATDRVDNRTRFVTHDAKQKWCPLIPVPEHGRLIDAEEFKTHFWEKQAYFTERIYQKLDMMPTIIPADKEGDNG